MTEIPDKVVYQFEAIRRSGLTNMFDRYSVQYIANEQNFYALVVFIEDHKTEYGTLMQEIGNKLKTLDESQIPVIPRKDE